MADFFPTHYITLWGGSEATPGKLTWGGQHNSTTTGFVDDVGNDNILTEDSDTFNQSNSVYSGWYVTINGKNYAVFSTSVSGFYTIPYDATVDNIGQPIHPVIAAGETSSRDDTLGNAANCFLEGTQIATLKGARAIETLRPGDTVVTANGTALPILWVWRQEITNVFGLGEARAPIRIAADALGPSWPARDLVVTADHALLVDGFLINAGALVNGTTIRSVPLGEMPARFTYYHIETASHVALMAENCPSESFVDYTPRAGFDNYDAYLEQGGTEPIIAEMAVPRISAQRLLLPGLRRRLGIDRAA